MDGADHLRKMHSEQCRLSYLSQIYLRYHGTNAMTGQYEPISL